MSGKNHSFRRGAWILVGSLTAIATASFGQAEQPASTPPAQDPAAPAAAPAQVGTPKLFIEQTEQDLGKILDTEKVKFSIKFTNTGDGVLVISKVQPSCGCTAAKPDKEQYQPGETGVIEGEFDPRGRDGAQHKTITITSNDPDRPNFVVAFKSVVEQFVKVEPKVVNFGKINKDEGKKQVVTMTCRETSFEATLATTSDDRFTATVLKHEDIEIEGVKMKRAYIEVGTRQGARVGRGTTTIAVRTNSPHADLINIQVVAEITGEVEVSPTPATLGNLPGGQPFEGKIAIKSRTSKPFKVSKVEIRRPTNLGLEASITPTDDKGSAYTVVVKGNAPARPGALQGELVVYTDVPGEEEVKIPFYGFVRVQPQPQGTPAPAPQPAAPATAPR